MTRDDLERNKFLISMKEKVQLKYNMIITVYILILIIGFGFFFTSKLWKGNDFKDVTATDYNSVMTWEGREISIISWTYSPDQRLMEVHLKVDNLTYDGNDSYVYSAYLINKNKPYEVEEYINENGILVLRIKNLPENWAAVSLHLQMTESSTDIFKIYSTEESIQVVEKIEDLTVSEFMLERIEAMIADYESQIEEWEATIESENTFIAEAQEKILSLEASKEFKTEKEIAEINSEIESIGSQISNSYSEIEKCEENISEYEERIENAQKEMEQYQ